ncbi:hypothetical protein CDAR_50681 [Caerostris darwini]|uniref:Uncharacterized protein n=1 Tax=Caerostris darwini TaxID=1538125 RepID=A0AAV4UYC4_9ARAC|nr:hypothetical protein CDAR_50681 [Caerostris darwini]
MWLFVLTERQMFLSRVQGRREFYFECTRSLSPVQRTCRQKQQTARRKTLAKQGFEENRVTRSRRKGRGENIDEREGGLGVCETQKRLVVLTL